MFVQAVACYKKIDKAKQLLMTKSKLYFDPVELFSNIVGDEDSGSEGITESRLWEFASQNLPTIRRNEVSYIFRVLEQNNRGFIALQDFLNAIYPEELRISKQDPLELSERPSVSSKSNRSLIRETPKMTLEKYRASKSRNLEAKSKIDFCLFLKSLYQQHVEMDLAIKEVQAIVLDSHGLFRLLDPDFKGFVTRQELREFIEAHYDIGRAFFSSRRPRLRSYHRGFPHRQQTVDTDFQRDSATGEVQHHDTQAVHGPATPDDCREFAGKRLLGATQQQSVRPHERTQHRIRGKSETYGCF